MDTKIRKPQRPNPAESANPITLATFLYMFPIFKRTYKHEMTQDDLFRPLESHQCQYLGERLEAQWKEENRKHKKTALHRALWRVFGTEFMLIGLLKVFEECLAVVVMPISIGKLVGYFEQNQSEIELQEAYIAAAAVVANLLVSCFISHPAMMGLMHITMKMRVACSALIYRKTLRLSSTAMATTTIGEAVNLLSNDVSKFDQGFIIAHYAWIGPIQTAVGTYLIYREIGVAAFFGMGFLLVFVPLQVWLGQRSSVLRLKTALRTDERVRLMNEIISGMQVIKMYCWEMPFSKLIDFARKREMQTIRSTSILLSIMYSLEMFVTRTSVFISVLAYYLLGNYISAQKVFAITAVYNVLRPVITVLFSVSITSIAQVNISVTRLQNYLAYDEKSIKTSYHGKMENGNVSEKINSISTSRDTSQIKLANLSAKWSKTSPDCSLKNINLTVTPYQTVALIGPVGSGKSSLLNILLQELEIVAGSMDLTGRISYASQEPWLFNASVRQNILFGAKFNAERYKQVIEVCALNSDIKLMPFGDKTRVGERGKALSGGQKARINLARCIYKEADIYLLDDPLSAVDTQVGQHLYERCIKHYLREKICILTTHQIQFLHDADQIVIMKDGEIEMNGKWHELQNSGLDFAQLMKESETQRQQELEVPSPEFRNRVRSRAMSIVSVMEEPDVLEEGMESGKVDVGLYWTYLRAGGSGLMVLLLVLSFIVSQVVANAGDFYISYWVDVEQTLKVKQEFNLTKPEDFQNRDIIVYSYSGLIGGTIFMSTLHTFFFFLFLAVASLNLHKMCFSNIIRATMRFFNNNPAGTILNRFSKDLGQIDEYIPIVFFDMIEIALLLFGTLILSFIVEVWLIFPAAILILLFYYFRKVYIKTSRSVKRIEGITRSPIFGHMTTTMLGLSTIRSYSAESMLIEEFNSYQDNHSSAWYLFIAANRCFGLWLDLMSIVFIASALIFVLMFHEHFQGGQIGLIITQYIGLIGCLQWGMRQWSELENQMISVERLVEYKKVEKDAQRKLEKALPASWPNCGRIEFKNICLKYNETDVAVLKNLNFIVQAKEKVGIVGRTGAGKSSIITALFQLYEVQGSIIVDGIDTTEVPLDEIRTKISIIPQEPVLFSGTMRKNLDPFEEYEDQALWKALDQVELKEVISEMPGGLNSAVSEGGTNFSVGQRQLVCLARALIRNNRILVMDEATANVDPYTDALIQRTIREKFKECTVLTIAHRLHTVMDSDKILVMDAGQVKEFGHPKELLDNKNGLFYGLIERTGAATAAVLTKIAKENYEKRQ